MEQEYKYMVCTVCATYNHAPYIVDAMNGFTMQETTFPVYYLITDDASTDGEPEVIKQYLADHFQTPYRIEETDDYNLICAVHKNNPNCNFIVFFLKYNHYSIKKSKLPYQTEWRDNSKYHALCEGDDYWTGDLKLQKQVNFLENNPEFIECTHRFWIKDERKSKNADLEEYLDHNKLLFVNQYGVEGFVFDINNYWDYWYTQPLTVVRRNGDYLKTMPRSKYKYFRDVIDHYYSLKQGKGMLLKDRMGVYRKNNNGIFAGNSLIGNAQITQDNLRTIYLVEKDKNVLPVLHKNTLFLTKEALKNKKWKEVVKVVYNHNKILPIHEKIQFLILLVVEPFMSLWRIVIGLEK